MSNEARIRRAFPQCLRELETNRRYCRLRLSMGAVSFEFWGKTEAYCWQQAADILLATTKTAQGAPPPQAATTDHK